VRGGQADVGSVRAYLRFKAGWKKTMPAAKRKTVLARVDALFKALLKGKDEDLLREWSILGPRFDSMRASAGQRKATARLMVTAATQLPAAAWAQSIRGFSLFSLATLVGEAGDVGSYRDRDCLVKRLGVAPPETYAMTTKSGKMALAIPRTRRSVMWIIGDNLIRSRNPRYTAIYQEQKARRASWWKEHVKIMPKDRKLASKGHIHKQAHRAMERLFIRDLYAAWKLGLVAAQTA
jgi:hypothetical protein